MELQSVHELGATLLSALEQALVDKSEAIRVLLAAMLAGQHVLLEDVPGVGKTTLVKAVAQAVGANFQRIQFTPDLLPADVTGLAKLDPRTQALVFQPGPLFAQFLLADEINRASPKTQSSLLEAMEERQVTVDGVTHRLPQPFWVLATRNPIENEGTFPLPEAQIDRFGLRLTLGYPSRKAARLLFRPAGERPDPTRVPQVANITHILAAQKAIQSVFVHPDLEEYILDVVENTRKHPQVALGASPRAAMGLHDLAQAWAALNGRSYVRPGDIQRLAPGVLSHRLLLKAQAGEALVEAVTAEVLARTPVPAERVV